MHEPVPIFEENSGTAAVVSSDKDLYQDKSSPVSIQNQELENKDFTLEFYAVGPWNSSVDQLVSRLA